ncbi:SET domain-containing protein-lysine N-methyltransferase [bacterium]|nr:SET domain-containing protein-lysine N-methyltransferase [bacterium]
MPATQTWVRVGKVAFGRGVFARTNIPAQTIVGEVEGRVILDAEYASAYCIDLGHEMSLEPRAPFRYLNHCCTPNCQLVMTEVEHEDGSPAPSEIHLETLTAIPEGAELTIDYAWSADGAIPCLCGSTSCRGWVVAEEELAKLQKPTRRAPRKSGPTGAVGSTRKSSGKAKRSQSAAPPRKPK